MQSDNSGRYANPSQDSAGELQSLLDIKFTY